MISDLLVAHGRRSLFALCVSICALAFVPVQSFAQAAPGEPAPATDARAAEYKELIDQALVEFKHKNWPEARVLFRRAHEISPNARTLRGMGIVSYEMRDYVQAVRDLSAALVDTRQPLTEVQHRECEGLLARARTFVGVFSVRAEPVEAEITLDGQPLVRESDGSVVLAFGEHAFRATLEGYQDASARVQVEGGEHGEVTLRLAAMSPTAAPVASTVDMERPPAEPPPEPTQESAAPRKGFVGGGLRYTWVALGASALFGAGAGVSWALGANELDDLDKKCAHDAAAGKPCVKGKTDTDTVDRYQLLTNVGLGLSAGAFVAACVLAAFEWPREHKVSVGIAPTAVSVRGSF